MTEINFGNKQVGDNNVINDYRGGDEELRNWKLFDDIITKLDLRKDVSDDKVFQQTKECVNERDKKGLKSVAKKYGAQFIGTVFSTVASEEILRLLEWINK